MGEAKIAIALRYTRTKGARRASPRWGLMARQIMEVASAHGARRHGAA